MPSRRTLIAGCLSVVMAAACGAAGAVDPNGSGPPASALQPLDLELRNSGLRGGYLVIAVEGTDEPARWHAFGQAELLCVTCVVPMVGAGSNYELIVIDDACQVRSVQTTVGGSLRLEIDPGPAIRLIPAPPPSDWMPSDSAPADPASIPCASEVVE